MDVCIGIIRNGGIGMLGIVGIGDWIGGDARAGGMIMIGIVGGAVFGLCIVRDSVVIGRGAAYIGKDAKSDEKAGNQAGSDGNDFEKIYFGIRGRMVDCFTKIPVVNAVECF